MRRHCIGIADAVRQHGGAAQVFSGYDVGVVAESFAGLEILDRDGDFALMRLNQRGELDLQGFGSGGSADHQSQGRGGDCC